MTISRHRVGTVVVLAAVAAAACGSPSDVTTSPPTSSVSPSTTPPTTVMPPTSPPVPGAIAAYGPSLDDGEPAIAAIDPADGSVAAVIVGSDALSEGAGDLFYEPSTNRLYYSRVATACSSEIVAVDLGSGAAEVVASGSNPVVSPDGRYLAYTQDPVCHRHHDVRVRDLETGEERVWQSELEDDSELLAAITRLAWSPDGTSLAVEVLYEDGSEIRLIGVSGDGGSVFDGRKLTPAGGASWTAPLYQADGSLLVAEACCGQDPSTHRLVAVDVASGETLVLVDLLSAARAVDLHPTADGILITMPSADDRTGLWALDGGVLSLIADGPADAVWLVGHSAPVARAAP